VIKHLEQDSLYVWQNENAIASMAAYGGITPNGIRVKSVYTPTEYICTDGGYQRLRFSVIENNITL
jgi:hypothetical protein